MHDPKRLQAAVVACAPDLELSFRPMFGGIMGYASGKPFASLSDMGLGLKLAGAARDELLLMAGARPLAYGPDQPPSKTYVVVPEAMLAAPELLRAWVVRSAAGVAQARSRPGRPPRTG